MQFYLFILLCSLEGSLSSARTQLDLLEQLTSTSSSADGMCWILSSVNIKHSSYISTHHQKENREFMLRVTCSGWSGYESDGSSCVKLTIRQQLAQLVGDRDDEFSIPLGKNIKKVSAKFLTISQKRNIRRQAYLNEVSQRNDSVFFATIGAFIILPPVVILGIAIITGYVQLFPWSNNIWYTIFLT